MTQQKPPASRLKRLAVLFLIVVAGGGIFLLGNKFYKSTRERIFIKHGREALQNGDNKSALFWAGRALQSNYDNVEGNRIIADLCDAEGLPEALQWRAQVCILEPRRADNYLDWAKSALRQGDFEAAEFALGQFPGGDRGTSAGYHELSAAVAIAAQQPAVAEYHFSEAMRIDPANSVHAINLATLRLSAQDKAVVAQARADLEKLAERPENQLPVLRALLSDALRQKDHARALAMRDKLKSLPLRDFSDSLLCLDAIFRQPAFQGELAALQSQAGKTLNDTLLLSQWMMRRDLAPDLVKWLRSLPPAMQSHPGVLISIGDALTMQKDWEGLKKFTTGTDWGKAEFIRHAMEAHAIRETTPDLFPAKWKALTREVENEPDTCLFLARLVRQWGWDDETLELWWGLARKRVAWHRQPLDNLWKYYSEKKDTAGLERVARQQYEDNADNLLAKNNYAFLCLLRGSSPATAGRLAAEAWKSSPGTPGIVSTFAYSLLMEGRAAEGLKAFDGLTDKQREDPGVALYYALLLNANGANEKAGHYLQLADSAQLLPEEERLRANLHVKLDAK